MKVQDLTVEVRNGSYQRVGQLLPADLIGLTVVMRYNNVGSWNITLPSDHRLVDELRAAGAGIIVAVEGEVIFSGYTTTAILQQSKDNPLGDWRIQGVDDSVILAERLAYPLPSEADVTLQTTANDIRTGVAETVMKGYVYDNISAFAGTVRAIDSLDVEFDYARGAQVTGNARFTNLQELLYGLAQTGGLGFTVQQFSSSLIFKVFEPLDRSLNIRMDLDNGKLTSTEYSYGQPKVTRVIVGGGGEGENRVFYEGSTTESVQAESAWSRRVEKFIDSRGSEGTIELEQSAAEALVDEGKTIVNLSVTPSDDQTMRFGYDWYLGDKVTVVVGVAETTAVVTEVGLNVAKDGVRIGATVGTPVAVDFESKLISAQQDQSERIGNLERNEPGLVATTVKQLVNNRTGFTLTKGQAVYINGAQGNRVTVTLARANTETTSSKTFGIVEADIANNQSGYILTEGSIQGVDTTAFTAGQAAWLSPDFSGGWTPTKPQAPNHVVLIGFVERVHPVNGSLFVKVQNGFELEELHNVKITSPTDGQFLKYQASTGLWINSN
jgi:hypothetical protein